MSEQGRVIRVGLLAYGAIGDQHNSAVGATEGLRLTAASDTNPDRLTAAKALAPDIETFTDSFCSSGESDLSFRSMEW